MAHTSLCVLTVFTPVGIYATACQVESGFITTRLIPRLSHFSTASYRCIQAISNIYNLSTTFLLSDTNTHTHTHTHEYPSTCATKSLNAIQSADACTTNTQLIHAPLMVNGDMVSKRRRFLLATLAVLIATIDLKPTIQASYQTPVTEAVDTLRHTYDKPTELCMETRIQLRRLDYGLSHNAYLLITTHFIFLSWFLCAVNSAILRSHLFTISKIYALPWSSSGLGFVMMGYMHGRRK